jgi:hypothetical protein
MLRAIHQDGNAVRIEVGDDGRGGPAAPRWTGSPAAARDGKLRCE